MSHEVIVDALPYIDHGYDEVGVRQAVSHTQSRMYLMRYNEI